MTASFTLVYQGMWGMYHLRGFLQFLRRTCMIRSFPRKGIPGTAFVSLRNLTNCKVRTRIWQVRCPHVFSPHGGPS